MTDTTQKDEYKRWQGYANALLMALTVLFAGTAIAFPKAAAVYSLISVACGLVGIMLTVLWFAFECNKKIADRPIYLLFASLAFGCQVGFLFVALLMASLSS